MKKILILASFYAVLQSNNLLSMGFNPTGSTNSSSSFGSANSTGSDNSQTATFITPPNLNLFGDSDDSDAEWDQINFSSADIGGGNTPKPDPFGFPDDMIGAPVSTSGSASTTS